MVSSSDGKRSFAEWLAQPQSIIALSALLLSLCGLFVALYEASLIRKAQRAAVWPHLHVASSITPIRASVWVRNTGVGPARVEAAALYHNGELQADWGELVESVGGTEAAGLLSSYSLIGGSVIAAGSERETAFSLWTDRPQPHPLIQSFGQAILDGEVELTVCYCSVFDECRTASLQTLIRGSADGAPRSAAVEVADCDGAQRSGI